MKLQLNKILKKALMTSCAVIPMLSVGYAATYTYNGAAVGTLPATTVAGDKLIVDITSPWWNPASAQSVAADVYVKDWDLSAFSGNPQRVITFNASLNDYRHFSADTASSPVTNITLSGNRTGYSDLNNLSGVSTDGTNLHPIKFVFNGAMSNFSGNIESVGSAMTVAFGAGSGDQAARRASASGRGAIKIGGREVSYNFGAGGEVTVNNSEIYVSNTVHGYTSVQGGESAAALNPELSFSGGATYAIGSVVIADKLRVDSGTTANFASTLTSTVSQTLAGTVSIGGNTTFSGATRITGSLTVNSGASLTIAGDYYSTSVLTNQGSLTFDPNVMIDLSGLTMSEGSYTLFSGGTSASFAALTAANIASSVSTAGYTVDFLDNGVISFTYAGNTHTWSAASMDWQVGTDMGDGLTFADGDTINFDSTTAVTLTGSVAPDLMNVLAGSVVSVSAGSADNKLNASEVSVAGTLNLTGDILGSATSVRADGGDAKVTLDLGSANASYSEQFEEYTGMIEVTSGTLSYGDAASVGRVNSASSITVAAGATLSLTGGTAAFASTILQDGSTLLLNGASSNAITASGAVTMNIAGASTVSGIAGTGTIRKIGGHTLTLTGTHTHSGTLDITSGTVQLGSGDKSMATIAFDKIIIREGATFSHKNMATDLGVIQLAGGTFLNDDSNHESINIEKIDVTAASKLKVEWNATMTVAELTGTANLTVEENSVKTTDPLDLTISSMKDFHGTLSMGNKDRLNLSLSNVSQAEGKHATISNLHGGLNSANFAFTGAGSLTLDTGLTVSDTLTQTGAGTLNLNSAASIANVSVSGGGKIIVGSTLNVSNSISLASGSSITAGAATLKAPNTRSGGGIEKNDSTQDIVFAQNSISNVKLSNMIVDVAGGESMTFTNSLIQNSVINLATNSTLTLENVVTSGLTVSSGITSLGTQNLTTLEKTQEDILIYSMSGLSVTEISGQFTLDLNLTQEQFDLFKSIYEADGMFGLELAGVSLDKLTGDYTDITLNVYDQGGALYNGTGFSVLGYTTSNAGHLVLYIPEPSTASLSLLALAGLLARRRRKTA